MKKDSVLKTFLVAAALCVFCSILVSTSAVMLKPLQEANRKNDIKKNLLMACKLLDDPNISSEQLEKIYSERVTAKVVNIETGEYDSRDAESFDAVKAAKAPATSIQIPSSKDIARIKRRGKFVKIFLVDHPTSGKLIVLPAHGKGLWSTLWGFLAIGEDLKTIRGFGFYQHGETPGLGGEVDNLAWKKSWEGKQALDDALNPIVKVIKGRAKSDSTTEIDGLSGATLTSKGVSNLIHYWLGEHGFGAYLANLKRTGL
ncbi:MAG: Na(+)-translocating NADH-quinone reductase subunit C [Halobacteriovoraceae bacterium]|jgi:Na+-transporting NADH:ubiquinone oxidoreductase subunit C|nr:Na(+)-translocating NADH-quinone reductase subunit C [Halobacteriovoraceae bacterium]MBT5092746.1 Na(+)-translocating NADH-quinone reductase subunit C [Halobacteriovoraceae bacterium]